MRMPNEVVTDWWMATFKWNGSSAVNSAPS